MNALKCIIGVGAICLAYSASILSATAASLPAERIRFNAHSSTNWESYVDATSTQRARYASPKALQYTPPTRGNLLRGKPTIAPTPKIADSFMFASPHQTTHIARQNTPRLLGEWARGKAQRPSVRARYTTVKLSTTASSLSALYQGALTPLINLGVFDIFYTDTLIPHAPGLYSRSSNGVKFANVTVQQLAAGAIPNPLPGSLPLMATALLGIGIARLRSKKAAPN